MDTKTKIMLILLSFQSGRNKEWCEKFICEAAALSLRKDKDNPNKSPREVAHQAKLKYLNFYAEEILSAVKA